MLLKRWPASDFLFEDTVFSLEMFGIYGPPLELLKHITGSLANNLPWAQSSSSSI